MTKAESCKKILALLLGVVTILCVLLATAHAKEDEFTVGPGIAPHGLVDLSAYDTSTHHPFFNFVELSCQKTGEELSERVDFDFGVQPNMAGNGAGYLRNVGQAYATYTPSQVKGLQIDAGKMNTHMGAETLKSTENWNYTRSFVFNYALPLWHTGAHVGYDLVPGKVNVGGYIYDGWNATTDPNGPRTAGGQVKLTPNERWTIYENFIQGPDATTGNPSRFVNEANATYAITPDDFWIMAETAVGHESQQTWGGGYLAAKKQVTKKIYVSPRAEVYRDPSGATLPSGPGTVRSVTLTTGVSLTKGLEARLEGRRDIPNVPAPAQSVGVAAVMFSF
jgi:hypothetical protein